MISKRIRNGLVALAAPLLFAGSPAMASKDAPTIGVVVPTLAAQFWNNYIDFMKKGAKELGVNLIVLNADNKPDQMVKSLEDLVAQSADGIIFTPYWATAARGLTLAKDANIPVILTDSYPDFSPQSERFPNYEAFVGPSDEDAGRQMAEALFAAFPRTPMARRSSASSTVRQERLSLLIGARVSKTRLKPIRKSSSPARWTAISCGTRRKPSLNRSTRAIPTSRASGPPTAARRPA
jgi:ABC-type sugar transport system substrate-binding protein